MDHSPTVTDLAAETRVKFESWRGVTGRQWRYATVVESVFCLKCKPVVMILIDEATIPVRIDHNLLYPVADEIEGVH